MLFSNQDFHPNLSLLSLSKAPDLVDGPKADSSGEEDEKDGVFPETPTTCVQHLWVEIKMFFGTFA